MLEVKNFCVASEVKLEHATETPRINVNAPVKESEDVKIWVDKVITHKKKNN